MGFLPGDDARVQATVEAIGRTLKHGDLVDRYTTDPGQSDVDGLSGGANGEGSAGGGGGGGGGGGW